MEEQPKGQDEGRVHEGEEPEVVTKGTTYEIEEEEIEIITEGRTNEGERILVLVEHIVREYEMMFLMDMEGDDSN
jgi:hypothetical protein